MKAAIVAGRVDAASLDVTGDPTAGKPDDPLRVIGSTFDAVGQRFAPSVWFSTNEWVQKHQAEAKSFVAVMRETALWANGHHRQSADVLAKHTHNTAAAIEAATRVTYGDRLTAGEIQPNIDAAAKYGVIKTAFAASEMISSVG
jgi:ABC-type nitrate/sulfonate/bicarbonate transport system substrate-binding protein